MQHDKVVKVIEGRVEEIKRLQQKIKMKVKESGKGQ